VIKRRRRGSAAWLPKCCAKPIIDVAAGHLQEVDAMLIVTDGLFGFPLRSDGRSRRDPDHGRESGGARADGLLTLKV
jgi:hypothetical protein